MSHNCPMCSRVDIPTYRALCRRCFDVIPWKPRATFLYAHRFRATKPEFYQETFIRVRELYNEISAPPIRKKFDDSDDEQE